MLNWQIGVEIELIAPRGLSRETLAQKLCPANGSIERFFYPQSEPSKIPNAPIFENLTLGFEVLDSQGNLIAQCVDDLTLQQDCQQDMPAKPVNLSLRVTSQTWLQNRACSFQITRLLN